MSDSEQEESIQSYDSDNEDIDFKEDYEDDYEESVKPKIKIGAIINEDIVDDPDDMEYGGMDSDEEDFEGDFEGPTIEDPDEQDEQDEEDEPTQVGRVVAVMIRLS